MTERNNNSSVPQREPLKFLLADGEYIQDTRCSFDGGCATVWFADNGKGQQIAVKMAKKSDDGDDFNIDLLAYEEEILSGMIAHPNIVKYLGSGTVEGKKFLAFEPLYISSRRLNGTVKGALQVGCNLALALDALHRSGMCHRDVKPCNVLGRRTNGEIQPVLIDFGIAAPIDQALSSVEMRYGFLVFSAYAVPPELAAPNQYQLNGKMGNIKRDVYGLGCVMFHLLTHREPYQATLVDGKVHLEYHSPDKLDMRSLDDHISEKLERVVRRSLEIPEQRYDMESFYSELSDCLKEYEHKDPEKNI